MFSLVGVRAQTASVSVQNILKNAPTFVETVEAKDYTMDAAEYTRIESDTKQSLHMLSSGNKYLVFVYSDNKIDDIRLKVYKLDNGVWTLVDNGSNGGSSSSLVINATSDTYYRFDITASSFVSGSVGYYGLLLCHQ